MASTVSMACWTTSASATTPTLSPSRVTEYAGGVQRGHGQRHRQGAGTGQEGDRPGGPVPRHHIVELVGDPAAVNPAPLPQRAAVEGSSALETGPALPQGTSAQREGRPGKLVIVHDILHAVPRHSLQTSRLKSNRPEKKKITIWLQMQLYTEIRATSRLFPEKL